MARKASQYIELSGPLFEGDVQDRIYDVIAKGIERIGEESQGVMMGFIQAGGFVKTGELLHSVDAKFKRQPGGIGFSKVMPTAVWPEKNRPTRTWIARGTRKGQKLRPGYDIFSRTATRMRQTGIVEQIADDIAKALN